MNDQLPGILRPATPESRLWVKCLTPLDVRMCGALGERARQMILAIKARNPQSVMLDPEPLQLAMDFALVYVRRGLDLRALLTCNDLDFLQELVNIQQALAKDNNRVACTFPDDVHLLYAKRRNAG